MAAAATPLPVTVIRPEFASEGPITDASARGGAIYSQSWLLTIYDWWVLWMVSSYAWACSVPKYTLPWFRSNVRKGRHLDIGVGTGYYLANTDLAGVQITLADLNQDSLDFTRDRLVGEGKLQAADTRCILHDITQPLPKSCPKFNSISMYHLLHCIPGPVPAKTAIFAHLKHNLAPDGVVFGTTVLGKDVRHNLFGRLVMVGCNWKGIFDNWADGAEDFNDALREHFYDVETQVRGALFLWRASKPKV